MANAANQTWNRQILEHESWLRTVVRSRVAADEAEDVLQSVLTEAIAFESRQQEIQSLGPWLYRLAVNVVLQFRRKCGRQRKLHDRYAMAASFSDYADPLDQILGNERQELVQQALVSMDEEDVEVLLLKYVHGWNYTQISEHVGIELQRVANRLRRARQQLKMHLAQQGLSNESEESA